MSPSCSLHCLVSVSLLFLTLPCECLLAVPYTQDVRFNPAIDLVNGTCVDPSLRCDLNSLIPSLLVGEPLRDWVLGYCTSLTWCLYELLLNRVNIVAINTVLCVHFRLWTLYNAVHACEGTERGRYEGDCCGRGMQQEQQEDVRIPPSLLSSSSRLSSHLYLQQLSLLSYNNALSLIRFSTQDEENMCFVLRFCASVLANTLAFQRELAIKKQNETFLQIAKNLFSNLSKSCDVTWPYQHCHMMSHDHHMTSTWLACNVTRFNILFCRWFGRTAPRDNEGSSKHHKGREVCFYHNHSLEDGKIHHVAHCHAERQLLLQSGFGKVIYFTPGIILEHN